MALQVSCPNYSNEFKVPCSTSLLVSLDIELRISALIGDTLAAAFYAFLFFILIMRVFDAALPAILVLEVLIEGCAGEA